MPDGAPPRPDSPDLSTAGPSETGAGAPVAPCLGRIVALDGDGRPRVSFSGLDGPPPVARVIGMVAPEQLEAARREARVILLGFLDGRADAPVIMSLSSMADLPQAPSNDPKPELEPDGELEAELQLDGEVELELEVDGERVIEAAEQLVLRCGDASITLRADGTVRVTGRDITSWARRRHRIRGGSVAIN